MPILSKSGGGASSSSSPARNGASASGTGNADAATTTSGAKGGGSRRALSEKYGIQRMHIPAFGGETKDGPADCEHRATAENTNEDSRSGSGSNSSNDGHSRNEELDGSTSSSVGVRSSFIQRMIEQQKRKGNWNRNIARTEEEAPTEDAPQEGAKNEAVGEVVVGAVVGGATKGEPPQTITGQNQGSDRPTGPLAFQTPARAAPPGIPRRESKDDLHAPSLAKKPSVVKRCLSTTSLVDMLGIQPICENKQLRDEIDAGELAGTVRIRRTIDSTFSGDLSGDASGDLLQFDGDEGNPLEMSDGSGDIPAGAGVRGNGSELHDLFNVHPSDAAINGKDAEWNPHVVNGENGGDAEEAFDRVGALEKSPSFLPSFDNVVEVAAVPLEHKERRKGSPSFEMRRSLVESEHGGDSSTFFLRSIASGENRTHVSDAPDYDYDSISSEEEGEDGVGDKRDAAHGRAGGEGRPEGLQTSPTERLGREVCEVLGLPNNNLRKVHRSIMSRDTELRLRDMVRKARNEPGDVVKKPGNRVRETPPVEERDDDDSSAGSEDHVFGPQKRKSDEEDNKWERVRLERRASRNEMKRERSTGSQGLGAEGAAGDANRGRRDGVEGGGFSHRTCHADATAPAGARGKDAATSNERSRRTDGRGETHLERSSRGVGSASSASSVGGGIRSRLGNAHRRPSPACAASAGGSGYESDDDGSTDDEEGPGWDRNVLTEGEYYVAMSMLVYIYSLLRETSMLGHTDISFDEVDVNSFQSDPGFGGSSTRYLGKTKSAGFIIRVVMDELEKKGAFSSVEKNEGDMSVLKEFKQWVMDSRSKQLDASTEKTIKELRRKVARRRWKRAIHAVRLMVRLGNSDSNSFALRLQVRRNSRRRAGRAGGLATSITDSFVSLANTLRKPPRTPVVSSSMAWMHDQRNHILSSLGVASGSGKPSNGSLVSQQQGNELVGESEIKDIINDALEEPRFFHEGSLLSNLIESGIEVVWFGDRHPNDVVYSICVQRQYKRVSVVFRGTVNSHNWMMNLKFAQTEYPNPITEDYPGRADMLGLHTGFSLYMMRQRKDDSLTKIEEIFRHIDFIGRELAPDGSYELSITGHSLGGALATILSFYAATSNVFSKVKSIRVFTFAAPRVGCQRFLHAFQHLEKIGKIRMARFTNTRDVVPLIPFHGFSGFYKHVGMHIRLLGVDRYAQYWLRRALDVSYPKSHSLVSQLWRGWLSSVVRNSNTVQGYKRNHTLSEYQKRIRFALEYRSVLAQAGYFESKKRSRLKTLDDYYFIKGASNVTCTGELTRISLEDRAKESVRREARKVILLFALLALLEAVVLFGVLKSSVPCEKYPILLYPLYFLTGCHKEPQRRPCAFVLDETRKYASLAHNISAASLVKKTIDPSYDESSEESTSTDEELPLSLEAPMPFPIPQSNTASSPTSGPEEPKIDNGEDAPQTEKKEAEEAWASYLRSWLWKTQRSDISPCVWGHCKLHPPYQRPYQPWGVGVQHPIPFAAIDPPADIQQ